MSNETKATNDEHETVFYCPKCYTLYQHKEGDCSNSFCSRCVDKDHKYLSNLIEIDKDISEAVSLLNTKGYITHWSCQGHRRYQDNGEPVLYVPYIYFDGINMEFHFRQAYARGSDMKLLASPEGWHWSQMYVGNTVSYILYGDKEYEDIEHHNFLMDSIRKWAVDIPHASSFSGFSTIYDWLKYAGAISSMGTALNDFKEWDESVGYNSWLSAFADIDSIKESNGLY